ncbi:GTPase Era [Limisalsivibrio acetivorans]|uniref:GTPase Era n=1 Tax=Limisalsivibrio acetivorans TaxID=1304888 RepID=UPI0003B6A68D|nr:GTPase Era [Limisalsivibrio acetivorans]
MSTFKSGFVSIMGRPNVGKSTLLNAMLGEKIAIVSNKPQTTRINVQGILNRPDSQIVFIDTPGYHSARDSINKMMVQQAVDSVEMVDIILLMVQPDEKKDGREFKNLVEILKGVNCKVFLLINKVDNYSKEDTFKAAEKFFPELDFAEVVPLSALRDKNVDTLVELIEKHLPEGEQMFDREEITTLPEKLLISEYIREQVFERLREEIPYNVMVETEKVEDVSEDRMEISASIIVNRESHKGMVIGKQGSMLKEIGTSARKNLEHFFGVKIHLQLWVKVRGDWQSNSEYLRIQGLSE